ncbi:MAG: hypothetical protein R3C11_21965 [Planctomycetaceae bacterium]
MNDIHLNDQLVEKCEFFVNTQVWPITSELDFRGWIRNFKKDEVEYAECLLNSFLYFSDTLTKQLLRAAFRQLAPLVIDRPEQPNLDWENFLSSVIVTPVTGEDPNPTDSGNLFSRYTRQEIGIPQGNIVPNEKAIELLYFESPKTIVFVDDFVGSGKQFTETWFRVHTITPSVHKSFADIMNHTPFKAFYIPTLCTTYGKTQINNLVPSVNLNPHT